MIPAELVPFLEEGQSILIGTRDAGLVPESSRGVGARVSPARDEITVFASEPLAGRTLDNLRHNDRIAVCWTRPENHRSVQLKGRVVELRPATPDELVLVERYRSALARTYADIGLPTRLTLRLNLRPCWAIRVCVEASFSQTPGPGAGCRMGGGPEGAAP